MACACVSYLGTFFHGRMGIETAEMSAHVASCLEAWEVLTKMGIKDSSYIEGVSMATVEGREEALKKLRNKRWMPPPFSVPKPAAEATKATPAASPATGEQVKS